VGFYFRRRISLRKGSWLNISKRGVSGSQKIGPFTFNSRGRTSVRLGRGLAYRGGCAGLIVLSGSVAALATIVAERLV
jgi:hypothetical protein